MATLVACGCKSQEFGSIQGLAQQRHLDLAHSYADQGLDDAALEMFEKALGEAPHLIEVHMGIDHIQLSREQYPVVLRSYQRAVSIDSESLDAHYYHGMVSQLNGQNRACHRFLPKGRATRPTHRRCQRQPSQRLSDD